MSVDARLHELGRNARNRRAAIAFALGVPIAITAAVFGARLFGWPGWNKPSQARRRSSA